MRKLLIGPAAAVALAAFGMPGANAHPEAKCTCRALGRNFELGQSACIPTPNGPRIAVCVMVLNNTSWQFSKTPCVGADAARTVAIRD